MGSVTRLRSGAGEVTLGAAVAGYLATLAGPEARGTKRLYGGVLHALTARFGDDADPAELDPDAVFQWVTERWGSRSAERWNTVIKALRAASGYWQAQGWVTADPVVRLRSRKTPRAQDRSLSRERVEQLLTDARHPLRDRVLWRMLYETAARVSELLALDVEDLDLPNRRARVRRKGGALDVIMWHTPTARLIPRYLKHRTTGPLFVTERKARVELPPTDLDDRGRARLGYRQAENIFKAASGGATLHTLRHSALSHAAEDGASTPMLMARSGHTSVRSLARYARVSAEGLARYMAETDPARRK
jgi:integrase